VTGEKPIDYEFQLKATQTALLTRLRQVDRRHAAEWERLEGFSRNERILVLSFAAGKAKMPKTRGLLQALAIVESCYPDASPLPSKERPWGGADIVFLTALEKKIETLKAVEKSILKYGTDFRASAPKKMIAASGRSEADLPHLVAHLEDLYGKCIDDGTRLLTMARESLETLGTALRSTSAAPPARVKRRGGSRDILFSILRVLAEGGHSLHDLAEIVDDAWPPLGRVERYEEHFRRRGLIHLVRPPNENSPQAE
jgi:hypothetical protein